MVAPEPELSPEVQRVFELNFMAERLRAEGKP
jgi:hypothetical protein